MSSVATEPRVVVPWSPAAVCGIDAEAPVPVADSLSRDAADHRVVITAETQLVDVIRYVTLIHKDAGASFSSASDGVVHLHKVDVEEIVAWSALVAITTSS